MTTTPTIPRMTPDVARTIVGLVGDYLATGMHVAIDGVSVDHRRRANAVRANGNGTLEVARPGRMTAAARVDWYRPGDPVPTLTLNGVHIPADEVAAYAVDAAALEARLRAMVRGATYDHDDRCVYCGSHIADAHAPHCPTEVE